MSNKKDFASFIATYPEEALLQTTYKSHKREFNSALLDSIKNKTPVTKSKNSKYIVNYQVYFETLVQFPYEKITKLGWFFIHFHLRKEKPNLPRKVFKQLSTLISSLKFSEMSEFEKILTIFALDLLEEGVSLYPKQNIREREELLDVINVYGNPIRARCRSFFDNEFEYAKKLSVKEWAQIDTNQYIKITSDVYRFPLPLDSFRNRLDFEFEQNMQMYKQFDTSSKDTQFCSKETMLAIYKKTIPFMMKYFPKVDDTFENEIISVNENLYSIVPDAHFLYIEEPKKGGKGVFLYNPENGVSYPNALLLIFHEIWGHGLQSWAINKYNPDKENTLFIHGGYPNAEGWSMLLEDFLFNHVHEITDLVKDILPKDIDLVEFENHVKKELISNKLIRIMRAKYSIALHIDHIHPTEIKEYLEISEELKKETIIDFIYFSNTVGYASCYMQGYLYYKDHGELVNSEGLQKYFISYG